MCYDCSVLSKDLGSEWIEVEEKVRVKIKPGESGVIPQPVKSQLYFVLVMKHYLHNELLESVPLQ